MQTIFAKRFFQFLLIAGLFSVLAFLPVGRTGILSGFFHFIFRPLEKIIYTASLKTHDLGNFWSNLGELKLENERLLRENRDLAAAAAAVEDLKRENALLREQNGLLPRDRFELLAASVVSQAAHGSNNWLEIDKGALAGITPGLAVIFSKGILIGRVEEVTPDVSKVMLLTNAKSAVNAMTANGGSKGILQGEFGINMYLDMVLNADPLNVGDDVVTSGIGGAIPRGLYLGKIQEVHLSNDRLFQQGVVVSPVNFSTLDLVWVVKKEK